MTFDTFYQDIAIYFCGALAALTLVFSVHFFYATRDRAIHETTQLRVLIGVIFAWLSVGYIYGYIVMYEPFVSNDRITILCNSLDLMVFPLVTLALTNLTYRKRVTWRLVFCHMVPFFVMCSVALIIGKLWCLAIEIAVVACYVLTMTILLLRAGIVYNRYIRNQYSSVKGRDVSKILALLVIYDVLAYVWVSSEFFDSYIVFLVSLVLQLIFLPVLKNNIEEVIYVRELSKFDSEKMDEMYIAEIKQQELDLSDSAKHNMTEEDYKVEAFKQKLTAVCEDTKLFITEDLTRDDLCREMGTNHTYFTRLLKLATGKNFNEYINSLRIDYAEQLLTDVSIPLNDIPVMVGFSSKSSYYSAFKARHNCTPLQYRASI